ncbi:MAG: glycosyltransferase family 2 protein [Methylobacterium mesophilicum]|nr:glycosyltransferase family 2 protein [Methylobacterium mesophilicum]
MRSYTALIRTCNSERFLPETLQALEAQTVPPAAYVFVDSGSSDRTPDLLPSNGRLHRYRGGRFNYSDALNQGLALVETDHVLIVSSHTALNHPGAMAFALDLVDRDEGAGAAYFTSESADALAASFVHAESFTGFNGVWNTCGLIRMDLLRRRSFRSEVFSAEDQEWSRWLVETERRPIASVAGARVGFNNPGKHVPEKRLNEYWAVALYVRPEMLRALYLMRVFYRIVRPVSAWKERFFNARLLFGLMRCRLVGHP